MKNYTFIDAEINGKYLEYYDEDGNVAYRALITEVCEYIEEESLNITTLIYNNRKYFDPECELEEIEIPSYRYLKENTTDVAQRFYCDKIKESNECQN